MTPLPASTRTFYDALRRVGWPDDDIAEFLAGYRPLLWSYFKRTLSHFSAVDYDDCIQEVVLRLIRTEYRSRGYMWPRVCTFARNVAREVRRVESRVLSGEVAEMLTRHDDPFEDHLLLQDVRAAFSRYRANSPRNAKTIDAAWDVLNGVPVNEVVERYGMTAHDVYLAKNRVLSDLRDMLNASEGDPES